MKTGRIMEGRRYSDGLHQAIEAKENVKIEAADLRDHYFAELLPVPQACWNDGNEKQKGRILGNL